MGVEDSQVSINKWAARAIPAIILGATGYTIFVVVQKICVEYLINPFGHGFDTPERSGLASAILVFYFLLLLLYLACYMRLIWTIGSNPGYTRKIPHPRRQSAESKKADKIKSIFACVPRRVEDIENQPVLNRTAILQGVEPAPPGIEHFIDKDVFICDHQGLPLFCDTCNNWKPDRTHHCSEVERCVTRMDHFCPWVGGIVSETTIKFFIQFLFYAAAWGIYSMSFIAWALNDRMRRSGRPGTTLEGPTPSRGDFSRIDGQWIAALATTGLLGVLFAGGMFLTTFFNASVNRSTNEMVIKRSYNIAVRMSNRRTSRYQGPMITYPLQGAATPSETRTFAIIQSKPHDNIWSVSALQNLKSVLGDRYIDWFVPLHYPPCTRHDDQFSDYPLGPDFERICSNHGLR